MTQDKSDPPPCIIATVTSATTTTITTTAPTISASTTTSTSSTTTSAPQPITQMLCASDRVMLYWFHCVCVQFYDSTILGENVSRWWIMPLQIPEKRFSLLNLDADDGDIISKDIYCRRDHIGNEFHIYVENSLPLKTYIQNGCTISWIYKKWNVENRDIGDGLGFVYTDGESSMPQFHAFCQRLSMERIHLHSSPIKDRMLLFLSSGSAAGGRNETVFSLMMH